MDEVSGIYQLRRCCVSYAKGIWFWFKYFLLIFTIWQFKCSLKSIFSTYSLKIYTRIPCTWLIAIPHSFLSTTPPNTPLSPFQLYGFCFFFNTPLSPISTPHTSLRKIANSISRSRRSFPWPLNGISSSFPGTWQGLGAVAECRAWFSPDRAKWTQQVDRQTAASFVF